MSKRYYVNSALSPGAVTLAGAEAYHLAAVCRGRPGDEIYLFNGDGFEYAARVESIAKNEIALQITEKIVAGRELAFRLEIASALPKGDRADFLIEKLTELGVTRFTPLQTARSVVHPRPAKWQRFEKFVIEASKQCGRNVLMAVEPLATWAEFVRRSDLPAARFVAQFGAKSHRPVRDDVIFAIGPEGGFTDLELQAATDAGWQTVGLGLRTLRVETAAIAVAVAAQAILTTAD